MKTLNLALLALSGLLLFSTNAEAQKKTKRNQTTGWAYNSTEWGGFEKPANYKSQITGPNLVFVEGGTFTMGRVPPDSSAERRVTVSSFYMDATEVPNHHYREFVEWMQKYYPEVPQREYLPDTSVWRRYVGGAVGEKLSRDYFRLPAFDYYPVVGIKFKQIQRFAQWRSDRTNEQILNETGKLATPDDPNKPFDTDAYLSGVYNNDSLNTGKRVRFEDGILLPDYRLPTEAEWEFAALALTGNQAYARDEQIAPAYAYIPTNDKVKHSSKYVKKEWKAAQKHQKTYPLPDYYDRKKYKLPGSVFEGDLNAYELFNMNDGVTEWVQDVYRPISTNRIDYDLNPFRNENATPTTELAPSASLTKDKKTQFYTTKAKFFDHENKEIDYPTFYKHLTQPSVPYQIIKKDGFDNLHLKSVSKTVYEKHQEVLRKEQLKEVSLEATRVGKGANTSTNKLGYTPGVRYELKEFSNHDFPIGFRCAMTRVGSPTGKRSRSGKKTTKKYK